MQNPVRFWPWGRAETSCHSVRPIQACPEMGEAGVWGELHVGETEAGTAVVLARA